MYPLSLIIGKAELCALTSEEVKNRDVVSEIDNRSYSLFDTLRQITMRQSEMRKANLSRKRKAFINPKSHLHSIEDTMGPSNSGVVS